MVSKAQADMRNMEKTSIINNLKNCYTEVFNYKALHPRDTPIIPANPGIVSGWDIEKIYTDNSVQPVTAYIVTDLELNVSLRIIYSEGKIRINSTDTAMLLGYKYGYGNLNPRWYLMKKTFTKLGYKLPVTENAFIPLDYVYEASYLTRDRNAPRVCLWLKTDVLPWLEKNIKDHRKEVCNE